MNTPSPKVGQAPAQSTGNELSLRAMLLFVVAMDQLSFVWRTNPLPLPHIRWVSMLTHAVASASSPVQWLGLLTSGT